MQYCYIDFQSLISRCSISTQVNNLQPFSCRLWGLLPHRDRNPIGLMNLRHTGKKTQSGIIKHEDNFSFCRERFAFVDCRYDACQARLSRPDPSMK